MPKHQVLELAITYFCNLACPLCSQATPLQKDKATMSIEDLEAIARIVEPHQFYAIKLSGGEPTLHPRFGEICDRLPEFFPGRRYLLATNGKLLAKYLDRLAVFDRIDLSEYPGHNDEEFARLYPSRLSNLSATIKQDYVELDDVFAEKNRELETVFRHCHQSSVKKIVQDRIYPCCVVFGNLTRQGSDPGEVSAPMDEHWKRNLDRIDIEPHCRRCWVKVETGLPAKIRHFARRAFSRRAVLARELWQGRWRVMGFRIRQVVNSIAARTAARDQSPTGPK